MTIWPDLQPESIGKTPNSLLKKLKNWKKWSMKEKKDKNDLFHTTVFIILIYLYRCQNIFYILKNVKLWKTVSWHVAPLF